MPLEDDALDGSIPLLSSLLYGICFAIFSGLSLVLLQYIEERTDVVRNKKQLHEVPQQATSRATHLQAVPTLELGPPPTPPASMSISEINNQIVNAASYEHGLSQLPANLRMRLMDFPKIRIRRGFRVGGGGRLLKPSVVSGEEKSIFSNMKVLDAILKIKRLIGLETRNVLNKTGILSFPKSPVRDTAYNTHSRVMAVARYDDSIMLYPSSHGETHTLPVQLSCSQQRGVVKIAWCPSVPSCLGVAGKSGLLLWSGTEKLNFRVVDSQEVDVLAWSPSGDIVAVSSVSSNSIRLWDVWNDKYSQISRLDLFGGNALLSWSPDGSNLLTTSTRSHFRIWNTEYWRCERYNTRHRVVRQACWSSDGDVLLFSLNGEGIVYAVQPGENNGGDSPEAIFNTAAILDNRENIQTILGGAIGCMEWDSNNGRLAVGFDPSHPFEIDANTKKHCPLVALFKTQMRAGHIVIHVLGYIRGPEHSIPQSLAIAPFCRKKGNYTTNENLVQASKDGNTSSLIICWLDQGEREQNDCDPHCSTIQAFPLAQRQL
eukprot:m.54744 g.54744  ORF g.54744 m.54744 type:complete len:544 (+) comp10947_c0_seq3:79-1710(+)